MSERVLLSVEDSDSEYYIIGLALKELGLPIRFCRVMDGEQALWFLEKTNGYENAPRPNLILLNLNLPKKDGFQVLGEIRSSEALRSIPTIIFTTSRDKSSKTKALALGAEDYISKPETLRDLVETLRTVCSQFLIGQ
ncbi:MAG TPA: response regulator [Bryobacteraceae bacterium]|jgi:chemotaxis family two-component system response regulator Rcp1